jgi:glycosyltransferase involved in cell wall biosynthesis
MTGKKIKILHILNSLGVGGMENGLVNILNNLPGDRFSHIICLVSGSGPMEKRFDSEHCFISMNNNGRDLFFFLKLQRVIKKHQPDIIHVRGWPALLDTVLAAKLFLFKGELIFSHHGRSFWEYSTRLPGKTIFLRTVLLKIVDRIITLNSFMRDELVQYYQAETDNIEIIANGVDLSRFSAYPEMEERKRKEIRAEFGVSENDFILGTVGSLSRIKNIDFLLFCMPGLSRKNPRVKLIIAGQGGEEKNLITRAEELKITEQVIFLGERTDIPRVLSSFDCYVQSSNYEGFSNTILEAIALGLPVICSDIPGNRSSFDIPAVSFFEPEDDKAFKKLVENELINPQRKELPATRKKLLETYSIEKMARAYERLYE